MPASLAVFASDVGIGIKVRMGVVRSGYGWSEKLRETVVPLSASTAGNLAYSTGRCLRDGKVNSTLPWAEHANACAYRLRDMMAFLCPL